MKNQPHLVRSLSLALVMLALAGVSACGIDEADTTETTEEALIVPPPPPDVPVIPITQTCQGRAPDATMTRGEIGVLSPTKYGTSGCPKAYVIDTAPPTDGDEHTLVFLTWADPWDRTEKQCTGGKLKLDLWSKVPGDFRARYEGTFEAPLTWDASRRVCRYSAIGVAHNGPPFSGKGTVSPLPGTSTEIRPFAGRTLRLVASALTPAGSTQPLKVYTERTPR